MCKCSFHLTFSWLGRSLLCRAVCSAYAIFHYWTTIEKHKRFKDTSGSGNRCQYTRKVCQRPMMVYVFFYNSWGLRKTKVSQSTHRKGTHWKGQLFEFPANIIEFSHLDPPMLCLQHEFSNVRMLTQNFACVGCALNPRPVVATHVPVKLILDILVQRSLGAFLFMFTYCMTVCLVESWYSKCTVLLEPLLQWSSCTNGSGFQPWPKYI